MDRQDILARLHLHAVLPVIAKVASFDSEAKQIVRDWHAAIQFGYLGGPVVQLQFADGNCRVYRQAAVKAEVAFWFPTPSLLNNMMTGQGFTLPLIKGFWNVKLLKGFMALAKRLEFYLKEQDGKELDAEMTAKVLSCKLAVATWGTAILAGSEPKLASLANHIPAGGTVNFIIKPDGPNFYFKKSEAGAFLAGDDLVADPTAELSFRDQSVAFQLVNGTLDVMAALGKQDVVIRGLVPMVDDVSGIMNKLQSYLG